jgi:hypothetical protein
MSDGLIGSVCDEREVPSSLFGFADERCETAMKLSASAQRGHEVRGGRE